jgi:hypothetical protein
VKQDINSNIGSQETFDTFEDFFAKVEHDGWELEYVPSEYKTYELCKAAVKSDGWALEYVPKHLRTYELCLAAVRQYGKVLQYVPEELRTVEMCQEAISENLEAKEFAPKFPYLQQGKGRNALKYAYYIEDYAAGSDKFSKFWRVKARYLSYDGVRRRYPSLEYLNELAEISEENAMRLLTILDDGLISADADTLSLLDRIQETLLIADRGESKDLWVHAPNFDEACLGLGEREWDDELDDYYYTWRVVS